MREHEGPCQAGPGFALGQHEHRRAWFGDVVVGVGHVVTPGVLVPRALVLGPIIDVLGPIIDIVVAVRGDGVGGVLPDHVVPVVVVGAEEPGPLGRLRLQRRRRRLAGLRLLVVAMAAQQPGAAAALAGQHVVGPRCRTRGGERGDGVTRHPHTVRLGHIGFGLAPVGLARAGFARAGFVRRRPVGFGPARLDVAGPRTCAGSVVPERVVLGAPRGRDAHDALERR